MDFKKDRSGFPSFHCLNEAGIGMVFVRLRLDESGELSPRVSTQNIP